MYRFFKKTNKAFTLVETLVAISIFTVSILGLMAVLSQGISDTNYAKRKIIAEYLAQEGIEYIRNMRDTNVLYTIPGGWNDFKSKMASCISVNECGFDNTVFPPNVFICSSSTDDCRLYEDNGNYNTNQLGSDSGFIRTVQIETKGQDQMTISSTVSWMQGSGERSITFSESLFNWAE